MKTKIIILTVITGILVLNLIDCCFAQSKQMQIFLTKLKNKLTLENFQNQFKLNPQKSGTVAGVRGDEINISKTFEPYWKGGIKDTVKTDTQNSDIADSLKTLENSMDSGDFTTAEKIIGDIISGAASAEVKEFASMKNIILKLMQDKKIAALKLANDYLAAYPAGSYRKDVEHARETIFSDESQ